MDEKIEFIDEFLAKHEDFMHGKDGDDITKCRKYLNELTTQLKVVVIKNEIVCPDCGCNKLQNDGDVRTCLNVLCEWRGKLLI